MILTKISMCGFRGTKEMLELSIPSGFMVIAGRNGSGKSTICDAIEFALTGHFRSTGHKEKGESIEDYMWWRGTGTPKDRFVTLWFTGVNGEEVTVKRTPDGVLAVSGADSIEALLCDNSVAIPDAMSRLCRTSIIRDEEITRVSVDLPESERFDFVRLAFATTDVSGYEDRAKAVQGLLDNQSEQALTRYTTLRARVGDITTRLSSMRSEANAVSEVGTAEETVRSLLNLTAGSLRALRESASEALAARRVQIDNLVRLIERVRSIEQRRQQIASDSYRERIDELTKQNLVLQSELAEADQRLAHASKDVEQQMNEQPRLATLASLHQSGQQLGPIDGQCPLCGSQISLQEFLEHLQVIQERLANESATMLRSAQERGTFQQQVAALRRRLDSGEVQLRQAQNASIQLDRELAEASRMAESLGVVGLSVPISSSDVGRHVEEQRATYSTLERSVAILETSRTLERIAQLEGELEAAKDAAGSAERLMEAGIKAVQQAKDAVATIRRMRGEAVDDSLAELTPLMTELYLRLRPHVEWQKISYKLRGDVRKMLSFEVGNGLNPSFVFSSGQRRAAGLAFLLSVYLARPWCRLKTLILDDPVQHVDDFRALNLTEVLAAIRPLGKQIICTTEDMALADLMCRRLRSTGRDAGCLVEMSHTSSKGVHVSAIRSVPPLSQRVLIPA